MVLYSKNVLYAKNEKMYPAYVSKYNWNHENQVILLMIPNGESYLALKKLSALRGITSKHYHDFNCLNYLHSFRTKIKLKSHARVRENIRI